MIRTYGMARNRRTGLFSGPWDTKLPRVPITPGYSAMSRFDPCLHLLGLLNLFPQGTIGIPFLASRCAPPLPEAGQTCLRWAGQPSQRPTFLQDERRNGGQ